MISIIVPVFNEGEIIGSFLRDVEEKIKTPHEILIAYDLVNDNTIAGVNAFIEQNPSARGRVHLVKNDICRGPSGAIRSGFAAAKGDPILVSMADLSDDLSQVDHMVPMLGEGYALVCPSRYCPGGKQELHTIKAWIPRWVGKTLRLITGIPTHDLTNSYRLYSKKVLNDINIVSTHSFSLTLEITVKAFCLGYKLVEIPTEWKVREVGKSKFPFLASLVSYLPWFFLALTANRFVPLPLSLRRKWIAKR